MPRSCVLFNFLPQYLFFLLTCNTYSYCLLLVFFGFVLYCIYLPSVFILCFLFGTEAIIFWLCCAAQEVLFSSLTGAEPEASALKSPSPNHGLPEKSPEVIHCNVVECLCLFLIDLCFCILLKTSLPYVFFFKGFKICPFHISFQSVLFSFS